MLPGQFATDVVEVSQFEFVGHALFIFLPVENPSESLELCDCSKR